MVGSGCGTDGTVIIAGLIMGNADLDGDYAVTSGLPETQAAPFQFGDIFISQF
jgi:hypothetical protein